MTKLEPELLEVLVENSPKMNVYGQQSTAMQAAGLVINAIAVSIPGTAPPWALEMRDELLRIAEYLAEWVGDGWLPEKRRPPFRTVREAMSQFRADLGLTDEEDS